MTGQETFEGVAFTNGMFNDRQRRHVHGAVIADTATMAGNGDSCRTTDRSSARRARGAGTTTTTTTGADTAALEPVPGSWQQLK